MALQTSSRATQYRGDRTVQPFVGSPGPTKTVFWNGAAWAATLVRLFAVTTRLSHGREGMGMLFSQPWLRGTGLCPWTAHDSPDGSATNFAQLTNSRANTGICKKR